MSQAGKVVVFPLYPDGGYDETQLWGRLEGGEARLCRGQS